MGRHRLADGGTTLERKKIHPVRPTAAELSALSRYQLDKRAAQGDTKTYFVEWRYGVQGQTYRDRTSHSYPIAEKDSVCVEDMFKRAEAKERIDRQQILGNWEDVTPDARLADYMLGKASSDVDSLIGENRKAGQIRPRTAFAVKRYLKLFSAYAGDRRIRDVENVAVMERLLDDFAKDHGYDSAIHCKSALSKYVFEDLRRRGVVAFNPCVGKMKLTMTDKGTGRIDHGMSLGEDSRRKFVAWILEETARVPELPFWGQFSAAHRRRVRLVVLDIALAQATCGFRIGELRSMTRDQVDVDADGVVTITIPEEKSKTHTQRSFPLWDEDAAAMFRRRVDGKAPDALVFPNGSTDMSVWSDGDLADHERALYDRAAEALGDERFKHVAGHNWRATLATNLKGRGVPVEDVSAILGHDVKTNRSSYTDDKDMAAVSDQIREKLGVARAKPKLVAEPGTGAKVIPFRPRAAKRSV